MRTLAMALPLLLLAVPAATAKPKPLAASSDAAVVRSLYSSATELYQSGEFVAAAKVFERAAARAPKEAMLLYNVATSYDKGGDRSNAITWYRRFVESGAKLREVGVARARFEVLEREGRQRGPEPPLVVPSPVAAAPPRRVLPPALPFVEQVTKQTYMTMREFDGAPYTLLGAGARKVFGFKVYAFALYVEDEPARLAFPKLAAQAGGSDKESLMHSDLGAKFIVLGEFGKAAVLRFVRDVKGKDTRESYRDALGDAATDKAPSEVKRDAEAFLALFDDVKSGDELVIRTQRDGQVIVEAGGMRRVGPKNVRLMHDIWDIWLGSKPISSDLKKTALDRIDTLGR